MGNAPAQGPLQTRACVARFRKFSIQSWINVSSQVPQISAQFALGARHASSSSCGSQMNLRAIDFRERSFQRSRRSCSSHRSSTGWCFSCTSRNSMPIPIRGFTIRTTASASITSFFLLSFSRTLLPTANGLPVHTKHPPIDRSEVIPFAAVPDSRSKHSASAANGCRIAYRLSRTDSGRNPALFKCSFMEITFFTLAESVPRNPIFSLFVHIDSARKFPLRVGPHR